MLYGLLVAIGGSKVDNYSLDYSLGFSGMTSKIYFLVYFKEIETQKICDIYKWEVSCH